VPTGIARYRDERIATRDNRKIEGEGPVSAAENTDDTTEEYPLLTAVRHQLWRAIK